MQKLKQIFNFIKGKIMSLFIGKNGTEALMVISTAPATDTQLVNHSVPIAFSSRFNYLSIEEIPVLGFSLYQQSNCSGWYYYGDRVTISSADAGRIGTNKHPVFVTIDGIMMGNFSSTFAIGLGNISWYDPSDFCGTISPTPSSSRRTAILRGNTTEVYSHTFTASSVVKMYIVKNIVNGQFVPHTPTNEILINNGSIDINGQDFASLSFLTTKAPDLVSKNAIDQITVYPNKLSDVDKYYFYVVNCAKTVGTSIEVNMGSDEQYIKKGDTKIFTSIASDSNIEYANIYTYTGGEITFPTANSKVLLSNGAFNDGDIFLIERLVASSTGVYIPLQFPVKYRAGKIIFLGKMLNPNTLASGDIHLYGYNGQLYMFSTGAIGGSGLYINSRILKFSY